MVSCSIAFVASEIVYGVASVEFIEKAVAIHFGEDRSSGDGAGDSVAVDNCLLFDRGVDADGVDEEIVGLGVESLNGAKHGEAAGFEDIDLADLFNTGIANSPSECFAFDLIGEAGAFGWGYDFGIAETFDFAGVRQDDSGSGNWPKQTAPAGFIDAGRSCISESPQAGFIFE